MHLDPVGIGLWLRVTARTSAVLLALSFASLALRRIWLCAFTQRIAANRHRVTLLFALSHTLHLAGIAALVILLPSQFFSKSGLPVLTVGAIAYALIYYMAWIAYARRNSPDVPDMKMQTFGLYAFWASFTLAFTSRLWRNTWVYAPLAAVMWFAFALRAWAKLTTSARDRVNPVESRF